MKKRKEKKLLNNNGGLGRNFTPLEVRWRNYSSVVRLNNNIMDKRIKIRIEEEKEEEEEEEEVEEEDDEEERRKG
uniref:Uncharacterized protein n=1 Tax=Vespula pensylvanica TaxID=30213 RepID=A0A834NIJ0_VESPE|nr:hypothetical protein H0235_013951 [Vespula pensylvanica]